MAFLRARLLKELSSARGGFPAGPDASTNVRR
jgi:hypothetical protein